MVYFRVHQPKHTPQNFPLQINRSFSEKHPHFAKALQVTTIVLASLALIALIGCIIAVSAGGAAIPFAVMGGMAAISGLFSATAAICSAKNALAKQKKKQLTDSLPLTDASEHVQYLTTDKFRMNNWDSLKILVNQLSEIDLTIQSSEKKLLKDIFGSKYDSLSQVIEKFPSRFTEILSLLRLREHFYRGEERHDKYLNTPLLRKNRFLTQITSNMIRLLPRSGGVFSIKAHSLSRASYAFYTVLKISLSLGVIAGIASLIIFLPPCIPFIAVIGLASLALGTATFLIIRGIRYLLEQSSINRKQLAKDIQSTIGQDVLTSMVHYQHQLLSNLHETLLNEAITARWNQPLFIEHSNLKTKLEELTEQYNVLNTAFEQALREDAVLRSQLEKRAYLFPFSPESQKSQRSAVSEDDSDSGFQEIVKKGTEAAKKRRAENKLKSQSQKDSGEEETLFSIWTSTKHLAFEDLWKAYEACTEEQQAILLEDYMSYKTLECRAALEKVSQELKAVQKDFAYLEKQVLEASYESNLTMMDMARVNQENHRLLKILFELQQLAQHLLDR
ncbi:hypothetical protein [Chlamydia sp.]|uniref:inclusion membrane protein IncM n=1 Tax=Chlamydia sp. TaxID=35827 RepID=UPI0025BFE754|nr:hypothetical protein [Chlamydia sp.]MBQ8498311.1 hypothetical protein [Chlamydia sp.]